MAKTDISSMDEAALKAFVETTRNELAALKRSISMGQETKTALLNQKRTDIARGLTKLNQQPTKEEK